MRLRNDILYAAARVGIDPYSHPFKPSELGLKASDYGSFSDYCQDTQSAKWNPNVILEPVQFRGGRPLRYLLLR